ncbi:NUP98 [Symbiodinium pilosum]|uniref:NUP98 protein n=1 Tax=Symbiodinium pilosum TaxID=2952 RepID=A0A812YLN5_SYMPI|nr:NUP98 [Symbiodinium pilosum]
MSYGLVSGWDEDIFGDGRGNLPLPFSGSAKAKGLSSATLSKASELLWRASDASRLAHVSVALDVSEDADDPVAPLLAQPHATNNEDKAVAATSVTLDKARREPANAAQLGSSRASACAGLLAMPVVGHDGSSRIRLVRLVQQTEASEFEDGLRSEIPVGEALLEAQLDSGLSASTSSSAVPEGAPPLLRPSAADPKVLLERYIQLAGSCFGADGADDFELLKALFDAGGKRQVMHRLSAWLARVNRRTVDKHLRGQLASEPRASPRGIEAAFHHLTANSPRRALRALQEAAGSGPHFDRLAAILAACGGSPVPGREQRRWLRKQVEDWRRQRVQELMGSDLWRLYSLLAGDTQVACDALDWRTAFGVFFWYGQSEEDVHAGTGTCEHALERVVQSFVAKQTSSSRVRPVPAYALQDRPEQRISRSAEPMVFKAGKEEPTALQFRAIQMAAGCLSACDMSSFDYMTHSKSPQNVALSWHFVVVLLALLGEADGAAHFDGESFQRLTQQYAQLLEQQGKDEWAVYVAHFVSEDRARAAMVRRLLITQAKATQWDFGKEVRPRWPSLPPSGLWHARALACEQVHDWCGALECWQQCGGEEARAVTLACGYLLSPALLGHASSPFKHGAVEAIQLSPMNPAARWLHRSLEAVMTSITNALVSLLVAVP